MKKILLLVALALACTKAHASISTQQCVGATLSSSVTSVPCGSTISLNKGDVVAGMAMGASGGNGGTTPPTDWIITICGSDEPLQTWRNDTFVRGFMYVSNSTQTCTPTVTYTGSPTHWSTFLFVEVLPSDGSHFAAYPVVFPLKGFENDQTPTTQNGITIPNYDSNDTIVSITGFETHDAVCSAQTATFTQDRFDSEPFFYTSFPTTICWGIQTMYQDGATAAGGPYTNTMSGVAASSQWSYYLVLRHTMPVVGVVQENGATTHLLANNNPVAAINCKLPITPQNGDKITGELWDGLNISAISASDGTNNYSCSDRGVAQNDVAYHRYYQCDLNAPPVGPVTVTATAASGTASYDLTCKHDVGLAATDSFAGKSDNYLNRATTSTTQPMGPIWLQETGTYLMEGNTWQPWSNVESFLFTPASPYGQVYQFQSDNGLATDYAATVPVSSVPTSLSATATTAYNGSPYALSPWSFLEAQKAITPYVHPVVIQGYQDFTFGGSVTLTVNDPETDAGLLACTSIDNGGSNTMSSGTVTLLPVISGAGYNCEYVPKPLPSGPVSVTFSSPTNAVMNVLMKIRNMGAKDDAEATTIGNTPPVTASAIAHGSNEVAALVGMVYGTSTGTYPVITASSGCNVQDNVNGFSDHNSNSVSTAFMTAPGTCSGTWNNAAGFTEGNAWTAIAATFNFDAPPAATAQPFLNLITQNLVSAPSGEAR